MSIRLGASHPTSPGRLRVASNNATLHGFTTERFRTRSFAKTRYRAARRDYARGASMPLASLLFVEDGHDHDHTRTT